jgi:hypothetical protein
MVEAKGPASAWERSITFTSSSAIVIVGASRADGRPSWCQGRRGPQWWADDSEGGPAWQAVIAGGDAIRTLDARHLSSALVASAWVTDLALLSLDERFRTTGRALGLPIEP